MKRKWIIFGLVLALIFIGSIVQAQVIPNSIGFVNDFAGVLDKAFIINMNRKLSSIPKEKAEIAVVTISSLDGYDIADYTHRLATKWGVGSKKKDNGIVLLVAIKDRKVRIEVGYGLESIIPDSIAKRIIEQDIKPPLKKDRNDWAGGLTAGLDAIIKRIKEKGDVK